MLAEKGGGGAGADAVPAGEELGLPASAAPVDPASLLKPLGFGLVWGDELDPHLVPLHADSARLSDLLNRLAVHGGRGYAVKTPWGVVEDAGALMGRLREAGHSIEVRDARYFANFGDLKYRGQDVLTPFWIETPVTVPGTKRKLLVPVSHSQHEVWVRGEQVNAALAFFFGIDGKAVFRPIDTEDQGWVMGRVTRVYQGAEGVRAIGFAAQVVRAYADVQRAHPDLPFGGYYRLGVCNDVNAMVEWKMTGRTTLYPLTLEKELFAGQGEVEAVARQLPVDRAGSSADVEWRILASMPVDRLDDVPMADLRADVQLVRAAWERGDALTGTRVPVWVWLVGAAALLAGWAAIRRLRRTS
jgi:hypothetical protein